MSIVSAIAHHQRGGSTRAALFRALVEHSGWLVPNQPTEDGSPSIGLFPGSAGELWAVAFSDQKALDAYAANTGVTIGVRHFVTRGRSLVNGMPPNVAGVGIDLASPHALAIYPPELPLLRTFGQATEIEDILLGRSKRDNTWALLRNYPAYRICVSATDKLLMAPDGQGRRLAAVFTAEDALERFLAEFSDLPASPKMVDGVQLFTRLSTASIDGMVFNCVGPNTKALDKAFAMVALGGVDKSAASPSGPEPRSPVDRSAMKPSLPAEAARPTAAPGPVASSLGALTFRPRIVRQDVAQAQPAIVQRALLPNKDPTQPLVSPMVCLVAENADGTLTYATPKALGTRSLDELVAAGAQALMREAEPQLRIAKTSAGTTASLEGAFATEALLVPELLRQLAQALGVDTIAVGIPVRGAVVAASMIDLNAVVRLVQSAERTYQDAGAAGLSPFAMVVQDGRVQGRLMLQLSDPISPAPPLRARSLAECGLYLNLRDFPVGAREENITTDGDDVVVHYACASASGQKTQFEFRLRKADMAGTSHQGPITYGAGAAPSTLICAGQFFLMAEAFSKACPGSVAGVSKTEGLIALTTIERAAACMDEVIKFIPMGQEMVPDDAFFTSSGQTTRFQQPAGRWSRGRLHAIGSTYRRIADDFRKTAHEKGWLY